MKGRIQLAEGMIAGTLTKEEIEVAEANRVVMSMVKHLKSEHPIKQKGKPASIKKKLIKKEK